MTKKLQPLRFSAKKGLKPFQLAVRGVLIRIGVEPNTELFREQLETDEKGFITVNSQQETKRADGLCGWRRFESCCADN